MSDGELRARIRRAAAGDARALRALLADEGRRVRACAGRITGDEFAAEEITHDALLVLLRNVDVIRADGAVRAWLMNVAVNLSRDWLRRAGNRVHSAHHADPVPDPSPAPDAATALSDARRHLNAAARQLPPHFREILALRYAAGLEYEEIAAVLGCSTGSVASRLHRAVRRLGIILARQGITRESFR